MRAPMRACVLALALASAAALRPPPTKLDLTIDADSIKKSIMVGKGLTNKTFNATAAIRNYKAAAASLINATKSSDGGAALRTLPARTGIGMLPAAQLATLRVPRDTLDAVGLGSDLVSPPLALCGAGVGVCGPGLCCSQSGYCARDEWSCSGTCQRAYSGMDAPCNGAFPPPVPKGDWVEAPPGGVCGAYVGAYCPIGSCCTQFGFCAPDSVGPPPPGANKTRGDDGGLNYWCGIASCHLEASPFSPTCAAAHKLIAPTVRKFKLTLEYGMVNPDGFGEKQAILVNQQFPGPTLEVNLGDQVVVEVINKLDVVTTMHWHGILQTNSVGSDGTQWLTQDPIPGALQTTGLPQPDSDPNAPQKFTYSFIASTPGTMWYHSHYDEQYADGAKGALIVKAPPSLAQVQDTVEEYTQMPKPPPPGTEGAPFVQPLEYEVDVPVILSDNYHTAPYADLQAWYESTTTNPDGVEPVPDSVLINGIGQGFCGKQINEGNVTAPGGPLPCNWAVIKAKAGPCTKPKTRLRLINAGAFAPIDVFIDHVATWVVEIDSIAVNPVHIPGQIRLNVGQRVSVAICSDDVENRAVLMRVAMDQNAFYQPSPAPVSSAILHFGEGPWDGVVPKAAPWLALPRDLARKQAFQQASSIFGPIAFDRGVRPPPPTAQMTIFIRPGQIDNGATNVFFMNDVSFLPPDTPSLYSRILGNPSGVGVAPNSAPNEQGWNVQNYPPGTVLDIIINNLDGGQHPIHLHGTFFTVMAQGNEGDNNYAGQPLKPLVLRDVHTIPANSYIVLRVPIFNTMPMFLHCHIEPHLGVGLGIVLNSLQKAP